MDENLVEYYRQRAEEYEEVYNWRDPHRQEEQDLMRVQMKETLKGREVIDIACGTGYWTYEVSMVAKSIIGIDMAQETFNIAETKKYGCPTLFKVADAYELPFPNESFNGTLVSFWFSHIPKAKIHEWIVEMHRIMKPRSHIFIADNTQGVFQVFREKSRPPGASISRKLPVFARNFLYILEISTFQRIRDKSHNL